MRILALDVDGVLLDADRGGAGHWTDELDRRYGITRDQLRRSFFTRSWDDVVNGRRAIEPAIGEALAEIGSVVAVEDVLDCWFETDFVPIDAAIGVACSAAAAGWRVVLATNQEHRRAAYLMEHLGGLVPLDAIVYSADLGVQKHESEFFERASARLGIGAVGRREVLFVDDVDHNVVQARRAGWQAIHATPGADWISEVEVALGR